MSLYASKGKRKSSKNTTDWSPWLWNDQGYWSRTKAPGETEYKKESPMTMAAENANTPRSAGVLEDQSALPTRSGSNPLSYSEGAYSSLQPVADDCSTSNTYFAPPAVRDYSNVTMPAYGASSSDTHNFYSSAQPLALAYDCSTPSTSANSGLNYFASETVTGYPDPYMHVAPGGYEPSSSDIYGQSEREDFQQARSSWRLSEYHSAPIPSSRPQEQDSLDASTHALSSISLGDSKPIYQYPTLTYRESGSRPNGKLDSRYRVKSAKERGNFWKVGRVFMMLWTEPARSGGGTLKGSHFSMTLLGQQAYSEIRRFVVIGECHESSLCSPIKTYSRRANLISNLPDQQQHAIIYTSQYPPEERSEVMEDGTIVREKLSKAPIRVRREQIGPEGDLSSWSRINYSKIYTVEHFVRVLNIGMVHDDSLIELRRNSLVYRGLPTENLRYPIHDIRGSQAKGKSADLRSRGLPADTLRATREGSDSEPMLPNNPSIGNLTSRLNDRYQIVGAPSRFFKKGRVFKTLWTEPVGDLTNTEDVFLIQSRYGENAFAKIRRFVVVREMHGCCICFLLNTYKRQGASKDGIKAENYAAVYPLGGKPEVSPEENLTKEPFPIKVEEAGESIDPTSRINFGKIYTVEHNIKVRKVGRIPDDFLSRLQEYFVTSIVGP